MLVSFQTATIFSSVRISGVTLYRVVGKRGTVVLSGNKILVRVRDKLRGAGLRGVPRGFDYVNVGSLLGKDTSNVKLAKTAKKFKRVLSYIYYGAPASMAGMKIHTCSHATRDCSTFCLNTAGKGTLPAVQLSRIARTRLSVFAPGIFWGKFGKELAAAKRQAKRLKKKLSVRPNGTTDQMPPQLHDLIVAHKDVTWYDYTAVPGRIKVAEQLPNYHITLSRKETKSNHNWLSLVDKKYNIACVVTKPVKEELLDRYAQICIDGDAHDWRTPAADGEGKFVLLTPKGRARGKDTGFVCKTVEDVLSLR